MADKVIIGGNRRSRNRIEADIASERARLAAIARLKTHARTADGRFRAFKPAAKADRP
jgi:hypothetical protein